MAVVFRAGLLCDEIRQENNGKYIVIGGYTRDVTFPKFPVAASFQMMCLMYRSEGEDNSFILRIYNGDELAAEMSGDIDIPEGEAVWVPVGLPPFSFPAESKLVAQCRTSAEGDSGEWHTFYEGRVMRGTAP